MAVDDGARRRHGLSVGRRASARLALPILTLWLLAACASSEDTSGVGAEADRAEGGADANSAADADVDGGSPSPDAPQEPGEVVVETVHGVGFEHEVIDADPPSGDACCLDVVTAGDVDGDGDGDVVIGAEHADGLSWYENPGGEHPTGDGWARHPIGGGDFTTDGHAADVDRDGDLDVVVSSIDRNVIEWWEQVGDPTTADGWQRHDIGPDWAHDLVVADIDGDGAIDVGAFHTYSNRVDWFRQPDDPTALWTQHVIDERFGEGIDAGDLDADGDTDLVIGAAVYVNDDGAGTAWSRTELAGGWPDQVRSRIGDVDGDGTLDVVVVADETEGPLAWYRGPDWTETVVDPDAHFTHSLELGDVDGDGALDMLAGVMHTADEPLVRVLLGDGGTSWTEVLLATTGTHNARLADLDGNGYLDVVGKNYDGPKQVEIWWGGEATVAAAAQRPTGAAGGASPLDGFTYVQVDDTRERFNDGTAFFGVAFTDVDSDDDDDIASGRYVYLNPGGDMSAAWERVDLTEQIGAVVDVMLATDVDGDDDADLIAAALPDVWWLEAGDAPGEWSGTIVADVPPTGRPNGQGYRLGDLDGDGRPEIVLTGGGGENEIWSIRIPDDPAATPWPTTRVTDKATDEQVGIADIDGDGDNDIAAGDMKDGGSFIAWFRNPGDGSPDWERIRLGAFEGVYPDRLDAADVDGDGRVDVVVSEENDGSSPNAEVMWYRAPADPASSDWERLIVTTQFTTNGLDVADLDGDGDVDLVTGEHRGDRKLSIWENAGTGDGGEVTWIEHPVDQGKESHLGARVWDLDRDGDLDIVSIGWDEPQYLHLWVND